MHPDFPSLAMVVCLLRYWLPLCMYPSLLSGSSIFSLALLRSAVSVMGGGASMVIGLRSVFLAVGHSCLST